MHGGDSRRSALIMATISIMAPMSAVSTMLRMTVAVLVTMFITIWVFDQSMGLSRIWICHCTHEIPTVHHHHVHRDRHARHARRGHVHHHLRI